MFGPTTVDDMKNAPRLRDEETVETVTTTDAGNVLRDNVVVAVTSGRVAVRPKRRRNVSDDVEKDTTVTVELDDINELRRAGLLGRELEIEAGGETYELPALPNDADEVAELVAERAGLEKAPSRGNKATRGTRATVATVAGGAGLLLGVAGILVGALMILTLVGILFGVLFVLGGAAITKVSMSVFSWSYGKNVVYRRPTRA